MENTEGEAKGHRVVVGLESPGGAKNPEWRDRNRGTKPAECPPMATKCRVDMEGGREET